MIHQCSSCVLVSVTKLVLISGIQFRCCTHTLCSIQDQQSQGQNVPTNPLSPPPTDPNSSLTATTAPPPTDPNLQQPSSVATAIPPPTEPNVRQSTNQPATPSATPPHTSVVDPEVPIKQSKVSLSLVFNVNLH